jgi:GNAT superfamily N-acetyltransferase
MVTNATNDDFRPWLLLAQQVEPLFGPMAEQPAFQQHLRNAVADGRAYCVRHRGLSTSGCLAGGIMTDRSRTKVAWLAVHEAFRGRGIGRALLAHLLQSAPRPRVWTVQTITAGTHGADVARALYVGFGFRPIRAAGPNPAGVQTEIMALCLGSWQPPDSPVASRPSVPSDRGWLYSLKRDALGPYVEARWGWDETKQRAIFLADLDSHSVQILQIGGVEVGCLCSYRDDPLWVISQLFIMRNYQRQGIGSAVLINEIANARAEGLRPALRVLKVNPARKLYQRMGLETVQETDTHFCMEMRDVGARDLAE